MTKNKHRLLLRQHRTIRHRHLPDNPHPDFVIFSCNTQSISSKNAFIRTQIFSASALAEPCGVALKNKTVREGVFFFICAAALLIYSFGKHYSGITVEWKLSPYLFPILAGGLLLALSVSLIAQGVKESAKSADEERVYFNYKNFLATVGIAIAYYLTVKYITFLGATLLLLLGMLLVLGERRRSVLILVPILTTGAIYVIFGVLLRVNLP